MEFDKAVIPNTDIYWFVSKDRRMSIVETNNNEWSLRPEDTDLMNLYSQKPNRIGSLEEMFKESEQFYKQYKSNYIK